MNFDVHDLKPEAVQCYRRAAALDPEEYRWPYYCAVALRELGSPEAIEWFERGQARGSNAAPLFVLYGQSLFDAGRLEDASGAFRLALAGDPESSHAHLGLAQIAISKADLEASRAHLLQALEINPRHGEVHGLLAEVYRRLGQPDKAELESRKASHLPKVTPLSDPTYLELVAEGVSSFWYRRRGLAFMRKGLGEAAAHEFEMALRARPDAEAHDNLGLALQSLGGFAEAAGHHRAALVLRPTYRKALTNLGSALFEMGEVDDAIIYSEKARQLDPSFSDAYLNLGSFHAAAGRRVEAIASFRQGLANADYDFRIAGRLAWLLATSPEPALRDGAEAVRLAETACEITGYRVPETLDVLATAYASTGQFNEAIEVQRQAYQLAVSERRMDLANKIQLRLRSYEAMLQHLGDPQHGLP